MTISFTFYESLADASGAALKRLIIIISVIVILYSTTDLLYMSI